MSAKRGPKMSNPTHDEVLEFVRENSSPFATTGDVAEQFPTVSEKTVRARLKDLVKEERLTVRKIGPHAKVWYRQDQGPADASSASPSSLSQ